MLAYKEFVQKVESNTYNSALCIQKGLNATVQFKEQDPEAEEQLDLAPD